MDEKKVMAKKYMAFISYSHADNREESRKWADWLHQSLETYEIPADLIGQKNSRGEEIPNQIYPVFQDEKELSASSSLEGALKDALHNAENLIYLSSPKSARSTYVQDELKYYKQIGKGNRMMALILSGEPEYGDKQTDDQCFPEALRFKVDKDGNILKNQREEPLAADARIPGTREEGFTTPEAYRRKLLAEGTPKDVATKKTNEYRDKLELAKLKIISGVLGVPLGELTKRDKAYQLEKIKEKNRRMKRIAMAISALAILAVIMGIFAWNQKTKAQKTLAHSLFASGISKIKSGEVTNAAAYIAEALRNGDENSRTLAASMLTAKNTEYRVPYSESFAYKFSPDGQWLVNMGNYGKDNRYLQVWDVENNRNFRTLKSVNLGFMSNFHIDNNNNVYLIDKKYNFLRWDFKKNKLTVIYKSADSLRKPLSFEMSPSGDIGVIWFNDDNSTYRVIDPNTRQFLGNEVATNSRVASVQFLFPEKGKNFVSIDQGNTFRKSPPVYTLYKVLPGNQLETRTLPTDFDYPQVSFSPSGNKVLLWGRQAIYNFDFNTMADPVKINESGKVFTAFYNPDEKTATIDSDGSKLIDTQTGAVLKEFKNYITRLDKFLSTKLSPIHTHEVKTVDNQLYISNLNKGQMLLAQVSSEEEIQDVKAGYESKIFFRTRSNPNISSWDYATQKLNPKFIKTPSNIQTLGYLNKQKLLYTTDYDKKVRFYDAKDGKTVGKTLQYDSKNFIPNFDEDQKRVAFKTKPNTIGIFSIQTGELKAQYQDDQMDKYMMSPSLSTILILNKDGSWKMMDIESKKKIAGDKRKLAGARFSPDGKNLMMFWPQNDVDIISMDPFKKLFSVKSINNPTGDFSNGDKFAISEDATHVRIWSIKDKRPLGQTIPVSQSAVYVRFTEDGNRLFVVDKDPNNYSFSYANIVVYDTNSGYPLTMPFAPSGIHYAELFKDESRILTVDRSTGKPVISVWEVPGELKISDNTLADDLELFYGRKYDPKTATVLYVNRKVKDPNKWYFQDEYSRTITPNTPHSIIENIRKYYPVRNATQLAVLEKSYIFHPLAKAAIAHYYSQSPETGYLADYFYKIGKLQVKTLKDKKLIDDCNKILNLVAQKIYPKK